MEHCFSIDIIDDLVWMIHCADVSLPTLLLPMSLEPGDAQLYRRIVAITMMASCLHISVCSGVGHQSLTQRKNFKTIEDRKTLASSAKFSAQDFRLFQVK